MSKRIIELKKIVKTFNLKNERINAIDGLSIDFKPGRFYAIMGHSGSGKSTLINVIGLLDSISEGEYLLSGKNTINLSVNEKARLRRDSIGYIFQDYCLDEYLTAKENVIFPMLINNKILKEQRESNAKKLLDLVGLDERANHFPREMSGGECQRVAIARCLANNPSIILADEPTGNLDEENEEKIFSILRKLAVEGKCVIVVSHSNEVKKYADEIYYMKKGKLVN